MLFDAALSAWATLALALLALIAAVVAGGAWLVQARQLRDLRQVNEKQLPVLEGQRTELEASRELREREERERREQFISQVFSFTETGPDPRVSQAQTASGVKAGRVIRTYIRNTGSVPLYDLAFAVWVGEQLRSWAPREKPLMPGTWAAPAEGLASVRLNEAVIPGPLSSRSASRSRPCRGDAPAQLRHPRVRVSSQTRAGRPR